MSRIDVKLASYENDLIGRRKQAKGGGKDVAAPVMKAVKASKAVVGASGASVGASAVRAHVTHMVRNTPQVMVKITGSCPDMKRIGLHIDYIARGGRYEKGGEPELELEGDDGRRVQGQEARQAVKDEWAMGGSPIPDQWHSDDSEVVEQDGKKRGKGTPRHAMKILFSMPPESDRALVVAAARASIEQLFGNHQYVMAHHDDTDHQHTHVIVKMVDKNGVRMNPRKADLARWRVVFAQELTKRGVSATATKRAQRLRRTKGVSQPVLEMRRRGKVPLRDTTAQAQAMQVEAARANEGYFVDLYGKIAQTLSSSDLPSDQQLAKELRGYLVNQGVSVAGVGAPGAVKGPRI